MLPKNFVRHAVPLTPLSNCGDAFPNDTGDRAHFVINGVLVPFLVQIWLEDHQSRFRSFFRSQIQLFRPTDTVRMQKLLEDDFKATVAAWTLCTFYNAQRTGSYPVEASVLSDISRTLARHRQQMFGAR